MIGIALTAVLAVLAITLLGSLVRVALGPTARDRLLGVVLSGTTGVGFLVVASVAFDEPALRDAALVICALAAVAAAVRLRAEYDMAARAGPEIATKEDDDR